MKIPRLLPVLALSALALVSIPSCVSEETHVSADTPRRLALPDLLSDHAVLQRSAATHVWGKATPYAKVKVRIGEDGWFAKSATAETTAAGRSEAPGSCGRACRNSGRLGMVIRI